MTDIRTFDAIRPDDLAQVGGKALGLARMLAAELPVPPGFCVCTDTCRRLNGQAIPADDPAVADLTEAYRHLGGGAVAVRSSAVTEDGDEASFAGQQETFLGVEGEEAVRDSVARCWASLHSERARAYRRRQGGADETPAMAVVVQRLVPAEVAGVLFTRDPLDPAAKRMLVEASWGLGQNVVAGRVTPDRFHLDRDTGAVVERHIAAKATLETPQGPRDVPPERQREPCLDAARLAELTELGRRVEAVFGGPRDVEWAWADGRFWLLQARPITAPSAAEREALRWEEILALRAKADPKGTVWVRHNLGETLPAPTPMTWALLRRLLSPRGGMGLMYRDLGFDPDPSLPEEGAFDLIAGRPYCNLSREPRLQDRDLPLEHSHAALRAAPHLALDPRPTLNPARAGWRFWLLLPLILVKLVRSQARLRRAGKTFARQFRTTILPAFEESVRGFAPADDVPGLLAQLQEWTERTLVDFARDSIKPTVLAAAALRSLEQGLTPALGPDATRSAVGELTLHVRPDPEADLPAVVADVVAGRMSREAFLERFGHRGLEEMELARPRWAEEPDALGWLLPGPAENTPGSPLGTGEPTIPPLEQLVADALLNRERQATLQRDAEQLQTYLALRETAKHAFMRGYAILRRILMELDRRFGFHGGIFYLTPEELPRVATGEDLRPLVRQRRRRRALALNLEVPPVLFSDDLEAIGRPQVVPGAAALQGVSVSAGVAEGPALVLTEPTPQERPAEPYILVCPSTDPAWVPLFLHARGLVLETGGVLSHGAIVAREFGLPAAAGFPGVLQQLRTGQRVRVDGTTGTVTLLELPPLLQGNTAADSLSKPQRTRRPP